MREEGGSEAAPLRGGGAEVGRGGLDGRQRGGEAGVQIRIEVAAQAMGLQAAAEQVEAEVEVARVVGVEAEEGEGGGSQAGLRSSRRRGRLPGRRAQAVERLAEQGGVD